MSEIYDNSPIEETVSSNGQSCAANLDDFGETPMAHGKLIFKHLGN